MADQTDDLKVPERVWLNLNVSPIGSVLQGTVDLEKSEIAAQAEYVSANFHATAIEAARADEREVWALAAQDIADSNHSYEAAKQFSRFARALRAGGEHD